MYCVYVYILVQDIYGLISGFPKREVRLLQYVV